MAAPAPVSDNSADNNRPTASTAGASAARYMLIALPGAKNVKLWKYFGFRSVDGLKIAADDAKKVICKIEPCPKPEITYSGNTTNLINHLQREHQRQYAEYLGHVSLSPATASASSGKLQPSIRAFFARPKPVLDLDSPRGREITSHIVDVMIKDLCPFDIVNDVGFRGLIQFLAPEYPIASRPYYAGKIQDRYSLKAARMQDILETVPTAAITCDLWTSRAHESYLGLTVHYVDGDWNLSSHILDCVELPGDEHTACDIATKLKKRLKFWNLAKCDVDQIKCPRIIAATSDNM